jgi:hypothetical protein
MSREIKNDFLILKQFIEVYSLRNILDDDFVISLSRFHKKYYAYLTVIGELQNSSENDELQNLSKEQLLFISESCSDIGTSFFNLFHGAYKSSKLILRSSIETFIKGFTMDEYQNVTKETSLYEIFRVVKTLEFFQSDVSMSLINSIHSIYKALCADVHTAQEANMGSVSALNHFPKFSKSESEKITKVATQLICNYIALICLKYNQFYHQIHYKNREIINNGIEKSFRPLLNNIN